MQMHHVTCNQQVMGSSTIASSKVFKPSEESSEGFFAAIPLPFALNRCQKEKSGVHFGSGLRLLVTKQLKQRIMWHTDVFTHTHRTQPLGGNQMIYCTHR